MPTPIHHHLPVSTESKALRLLIAFLLRGKSSVSSIPSLLTLPVAFATPEAVLVGFIVMVGSIWGGLYARYNGCMGEPSN